VAVEPRTYDPRSQKLSWPLRLADAGPRPLYRAALASLAATSLLTTLIALWVRPRGPLRAPQRDMIIAAAVALCVSAVLGLLSALARGRAQPAWLDRAMDPKERAAVWLALAAWFPFLAIVAYYRAEATLPPSVRWINFGFTDKRWETAAYLLGTLAPIIFLVTAARLLRVARDHPQSRRDWLAGLFPRFSADEGATAATPDASPSDARARRWRRVLVRTGGIVTALGLAWYFFGPPWYLDRTTSPISYQEDVFLVGFQAIARGHLPYIGVAGVQYGPGTQLASNWFMHHIASFSVVGFRESWATYEWIGASFLFAVFFLAFGYVRGLAVSLLSALAYPSLQEVAFNANGHFDGYWAWANPLRYAGAIALIILLPAVIRRCPSWRGAAGGVVLGLAWGLMSYMGQENLAAGAIGALAVGGLLLLSHTFSWPAVRAGLLGVLSGFLLVWLPILGFYAAHGDLGQFLNLYFLSPRYVAEGYSDTTWQGASHEPSPMTTMFYVLPFLLAVMTLLAALEFRPLRIAAEWSRERILLVVTLLATIVLYQGALLRSDTSHMTGTLLAIPALVIVAGTVLPRLLGARLRATRIVCGTVLIAGSFALLPAAAYSWPSLRAAVEAPYIDRQVLATHPRSGQLGTLAARRVGPGLAGAPFCCDRLRVPMSEFINAMNRLHAIIGNRVTYVVDVRNGYPGLVYFVADLTPAPVLFDKYTTILNEPQLRGYFAYFRSYVLARTQALVTDSVRAPEARYFLQRYPRAQRITLFYGHQPYYVLLRPPSRT
jgi:hypothetical protein